ncbi:MAG: nucleotidyltransferase family protein, partial [Bacteroidota bacterium]
IISAAYQDTLGVPAIFPKTYFQDLKMLQEQAGAKKIIKKYQNFVIPFPCPEAAFDIDTEADYTHLLKH